MNNRTKALIAGVASSAIIGGGMLLAQTASAAGTTATGPWSGLATAIAQKFNLDQTAVQQVVDTYGQEQRTTMEQDRTQKEADRLAAAVKAGTLTQAQSDLITAKLKEVKTQMDALRPSDPSTETQAERDANKTKMDQLQTDLKAWATQNSIDSKWLMPFGGGHGGPRGGMPPMSGDSATAPATAQ